MKDLVTRDTGNSRLLKSSIPAGTTWEEALALLRAGNFPIDLKGLNSAGVSTAGSAYSKANVLPDSLCSSLGITSSTAEPKDAWNALLQRINTVNTSLTDFIANDFPQPSKQGVSRPNLLDNWYFYGGGSQNGAGRFPINQRGNTSETENKYFIDRWIKTNSYGTLSLALSGVQIVSNGSNYNNMSQRLEYPGKLLGRQVTISFRNSSGSLTSATGTIPSSFPSEETVVCSTSTIGSVMMRLLISSSDITVQLRSSATSSTAVTAAKLELGPNQTLCRQSGSSWIFTEIPSYAVELTKCQRHMYVFPKRSGSADTTYFEDAIGIGTAHSRNSFYGFIPLPTTMRTTPTLAHNLYLLTRDGTYRTLSSTDNITFYTRPNGLTLECYEGSWSDYLGQLIFICSGGSNAPQFNANL